MNRLLVLALGVASFLPIISLSGCHDDDHDWDHHDRRVEERPAGYHERDDVIIRGDDYRSRDSRDRDWHDRDDRVHY